MPTQAKPKPLSRLVVGVHPNQPDSIASRTAANIEQNLGLPLAKARLLKVFTLSGISPEQAQCLLNAAALHDPVLHAASLTPGCAAPGDADWILEVGFRPGVTDNEGHTARDTAALVLGCARSEIAVYTARQYHFWGDLTLEDVQRIGRDLLANELIERFRIKSKAEWAEQPGFEPQAAAVSGESSDQIDIVPLSGMTDEQLIAYSREHTLALSLNEMQVIRAYFARPEVAAQRATLKLPADPTDAELEVLAQTWSEHCKHKIFASKIEYQEQGGSKTINSLYKTYIQGPTASIRTRLGDEDFCRSVFTDNAGVVAFNDKFDVCIKVETHNSPSALDPYGGALTGIVGVNRDPMGTGMGAKLVCNTDVFCFASPFYDQELPPRLLHPRRVLEGVRSGVEDGGNKSGVPTVNGSIVFEPRYLGKPLVYCGTVGLLPKTLHGKPGYEKQANPGDAVVMVGGRIGKDGIHGATFSSEELHEGSPATAVQIGDPITQRKMYDFILRARDLGLYSAITDNGAGGLSSSVGEMSEQTGGCCLDLAKAPLKYDGLRPWEILLSEAQERMTLAVPQDKLAELLALAEHLDVEATSLGQFTDSGYFEVRYLGKPVAFLSMDFLHDGVPQLELTAEEPTLTTELDAPLEVDDQPGLLRRMLSRLNICSKEYVVRQYDHEVGGASVIKPLVGLVADGPSDAAVLRPDLNDWAGIVLSHGICPKFSDFDAYAMTANAIDEAVRNAVAVGADPDRLAGVDNFCWSDPILSPSNPQGPYKLGQLVRSCQALSRYCLDFGVPCVSGKDSMKNDYSYGEIKISIPPTLLFSVLGVIPDVRKAMSSDFKRPGDYIYLLGRTSRELAGSEAADELGHKATRVPQVDAASALSRYRALYQAVQQGLVNACHDLSDGGLAVALAEMCIGGRIGACLDITRVVCPEQLTLTELLYSESASRLLVSVAPDKAEAFEQVMAGQLESTAARVGQVTAEPKLTVRSGEADLFSLDLADLVNAFKAPFANF